MTESEVYALPRLSDKLYKRTATTQRVERAVLLTIHLQPLRCFRFFLLLGLRLNFPYRRAMQSDDQRLAVH